MNQVKDLHEFLEETFDPDEGVAFNIFGREHLDILMCYTSLNRKKLSDE